MTESDKWFAAKVMQRRKGRGMSCEDLADLLGMSRVNIFHIENGKQKIFLWQAVRLAKILNINLNKIPIGEAEAEVEE